QGILIAGVCVVAGVSIGCSHDSVAAELASLPIQIDKPLGDDLRLAGLRITTRPDRRSWIVTVSSTVLHARNPRPRLWVHAYPQESPEYFTVDPAGPLQPADVGHIVKDEF